ncbi:PREDICTED: structural maintenance of chromosomes protein 1A-like isoform X2 [Amphimedon queenslandica]|uniref:Death domain-containing protein n=1 Tax=Amphimedon queenslandica TaxID=400682 RepID=A0A1X7UE21_AMPQE|nr:PREDICTED: structural maintenance of chromosomes protein 1A-like isoform X2 [Amphimedon queenslandica]|eukprot:XP_019854838.1 PREDICTED: structural maintenance of chromosomes protein 1A-like isoform X2 [Amphimedon queenslandica]
MASSNSSQISLIEKAEEESKRYKEVSVKASGVGEQLKVVEKNTELISHKLERMEKDREELAKKNEELYQLKEKLRKTENELRETKTSLKENEEELEVLRVANNELKTELLVIKEKYTISIVERDKLSERNQLLHLEKKKLNSENEEQAQNNCKLVEELDTLRSHMREMERPSNLPMRQDSLISDSSFSPSSGQPLRRMSSTASSTSSKFVPTPPHFNLKYLMQLLGDGADSWYQIGIQLDVPSSKLRSIRNENQQDVDRLSRTLEHWLNDAKSELSYDTIYEVLQSPSVKRKELIPTEFKWKYY